MIDIISSNNSTPTNFLYEYISAFGIVAIAFAIIMIGIKMLLSTGKKDVRENGMEALGKVAVGGFILGLALILAGFLGWITKTSGVELATAKLVDGTTPTLTNANGNSTFAIRALADIISDVVEMGLNALENAAGFEPLETLIFNKSSVLSVAKDLPPFSGDEWHNMNYMYICICTIVAPILLIMVAKTGFSLVLYADNTAKKVDLKEELSRWIFCSVLLATAPIFVYALFKFFNLMTDSLSLATKSVWSDSWADKSPVFNSSMISKIDTGNVLTDAIIKALYLWQEVKINLVFMSRKVVLTIMYCFTPIAVAFWGVNQKVRAMSIWFGEMITNAAMQFFYAFTFATMVVALGTATWSSWFLAIIWMTALIKIAEMLRNSLQGFFTQLSGVDENSMGSNALGSIGKTFSGMTAAMGMTMAGDNGFHAKDVMGKLFGGGEGKAGPGGSNNASIGNEATAAKDSAAKESKGSELDVKSKSPNSGNKENGSNGASNDGTGDPGGKTGKLNDADISANSAANKGTEGISDNNESPDGSEDPSAVNDADVSANNAVNQGAEGISDNNESPDGSEDSSAVNDADISANSAVNQGDADINGGSDQSTSNSEGENTETSTAVPQKVMDSIKKQNGYNKLLEANMSRHMPSNHGFANAVKGAMNTVASGDSAMAPFAQGVGNIIGGIGNLAAAHFAVKDTVAQMQELSGKNKDGNFNMSKLDARKSLLGNFNLDNTKFGKTKAGKVISKAGGSLGRALVVKTLASGNSKKIASKMAKIHPGNSLNNKQRAQIITKTKSYTSMDGFNGGSWKD